MDVEHGYKNVNGIRLHYVTAGEGPLLILLHGFPQFWYAWRNQIPALAKKFKVVAPDLRGYGDSDKPLKVADYRLHIVADDIVELIHQLGEEKADIVGQDWGGAVAWELALNDPQVVNRLVIINAPYPTLIEKALRSNFTQMKKSWYMFFFQLPYVPEKLLGMDLNKTLFKDMAKGTPRDTYIANMKKPNALTGALNYYRAVFRYKNNIKNLKIQAPTLFIWGEDDPFLGKELTYGMEPYFTNSLQIQYIPKCGHFVHEEQPEKVNELLLNFL